MGMYIVPKGTPCIIGKHGTSIHHPKWVTRKNVVFYKEEVAMDEGDEILFFRDLHDPKEADWWMLVSRCNVQYG